MRGRSAKSGATNEEKRQENSPHRHPTRASPYLVHRHLQIDQLISESHTTFPKIRVAINIGHGPFSNCIFNENSLVLLRITIVVTGLWKTSILLINLVWSTLATFCLRDFMRPVEYSF